MDTHKLEIITYHIFKNNYSGRSLCKLNENHVILASNGHLRIIEIDKYKIEIKYKISLNEIPKAIHKINDTQLLVTLFGGGLYLFNYTL